MKQILQGECDHQLEILPVGSGSLAHVRLVTNGWINDEKICRQSEIEQVFSGMMNQERRLGNISRTYIG